ADRQVSQPVIEQPQVATAPAEESKAAPVEIARDQDSAAAAPEPMPMADNLAEAEIAPQAVQAAPTVGGNASVMRNLAAPAGAMMESDALHMPAPTPIPSIINQPSGDEFTSFDEQRLKAVADEPVSTFSIDVDTASYAYM